VSYEPACVGRDKDADAGHVPASPRVSELIVEHSVRVWRSLKYLGVAEGDLADASQEVFLVVHRRFSEFQGRSSFTTWVYGICLGVARNFRRQKLRHACHEGRFEVGQEATQELDLDLERARRRLRAALLLIPSEQREVFVLYEIEELNMRAIAKTLGCPLFTAYSRLRLARKALTRILSNSGGPL
jgi:RNA polymerase sigma-70 factor, ECF subfamily